MELSKRTPLIEIQCLENIVSIKSVFFVRKSRLKNILIFDLYTTHPSVIITLATILLRAIVIQGG